MSCSPGTSPKARGCSGQYEDVLAPHGFYSSLGSSASPGVGTLVAATSRTTDTLGLRHARSASRSGRVVAPPERVREAPAQLRVRAPQLRAYEQAADDVPGRDLR